jgi:hypothetical protein
MVDYPIPDDNLDGVTREELTRARIAKHKEILTPETQPPAVQQRLDESFTRVFAGQEALRAELHQIVQVLQEIRDVTIKNAEAS